MQENGIPYTGTGEQVSFRKKNPWVNLNPEI
jgi:hypothetical protein